MAVNFNEAIEREVSRISQKEQILGITLNQPFVGSNSGSRKIMYNIQAKQALPLLKPETPYIQTGFENRFGEESSSVIRAKTDYTVVGKVVKYLNNPNHQYYLILLDNKTNKLDVFQRISYVHTTETYGYLYDNSNVDILDVGDIVENGDLIRQSTSFDEYGNHCEGVNLLATYIAMEDTMEDCMIISESARKKLGSPFLKKVTININDNDIPLNLHGNDDYYKAFPEVGETIPGGLLCCIRRDNNDEALFTQSWDNLKRIMPSDEKVTIEGDIIDIEIHSNTPENLQERSSYQQLLMYYNERHRYLSDLVAVVDNCMIQYNCTGMSDNLREIYELAKKELANQKFMKDGKIYSGTIVEFTVVEYNYPNIGHKTANRFGGKGVIAEIRPDDEMAVIETGEVIDVYFNQATCVNRLNDGQLKEQSLSMISKRLLEYLNNKRVTTNQVVKVLGTFINIVAPTQYKEFMSITNSLTKDELEFFLDSILSDKSIVLSILPLTEPMSLDKLNEIYHEFPWIKQYKIYSKLKGSNGKIRYVESLRLATVGYIYMYRLKQYAEEKFSVTNLSATNIRNENTRSKANKNYRATHQNTPIRFGDMESGDMGGHMGMETFVTALLIYSLSPVARNEMEQLWTQDPFDVDIKLTPDCKNRSAEILNVYFKQIGLKLIFEKVYKKAYFPMSLATMTYEDTSNVRRLMQMVDPDERIDLEKDAKRYDEYYESKERTLMELVPMRIVDKEEE